MITPKDEAGLIAEHIAELRLAAETNRYNAPDEHNYRHQTADSLDRLATALERLSAPGWVMVPCEPTEEMIEAGWKAGKCIPRALLREAWSAMLAAAPTPGDET